jgi:tetratricopeptide (TPR) repeat protein
MRVFVVLVLATILLVPAAVAQKPPVATPPPAPLPSPTAPPNRTATPFPSGSGPTQPGDEYVMFLLGRVATNDGTAIPNDAMVERVCDNKISQQVYASSNGAFNMQLGSMADSFLDASGDSTSQIGASSKGSMKGIPKRDLATCELRAAAAGFYSAIIGLAGLDSFGSRMDVGVILMHRATKVEGTTLSATPYKAPKDARRAYEKGVEAERKGNLDGARKYFEMALKLYPKYASAWFQLGTILEKEDQKDAARGAYTQAKSLDASFLPAYMSLASMAYEEGNWPVVLALTDHILDRDPLNRVVVTDYIVDLDPLNYTEAYFYNAVANYSLNKFEEAERSGLKAEHIDLITHFPQLHLIMGEIFARKNDYATAISEVETYLALAPHAANADQVREQLAKLEKLNGTLSTSEKTDHK